MLPLIYIALLILLVIAYSFAPIFPDSGFLILLLVLNFLALIFFFFRKEENVKIRGKIFRHSTLVLLGYLIVHFQVHLDFLFGNLDENYYSIWINKNYVLKAVVLSSIGLISFFLGYLSYKRKKEYINRVLLNFVNTRFLEYGSLFFLFLYFYFINPLYLIGNYGIVDMGSAASYIAAIFEAILMASIIQSSFNLSILNVNISFWQYVKSIKFITWFVLFVYLVSVWLSGDRGPIIFFSIAILGSFVFVTKRKLSIPYLILSILIGSILITFLGRFRALDSTMTFSEKTNTILQGKDENRFGYDSFSPPTQELANSIKCLHYSVSHVPEVEFYMSGRFQFQQLFSIVPFSSVINNIIFPNNEFKYGGSPNYITWIEQGDYVYSGTGTTIISDFYLDFGVIGVIVGMFIVGYFMRYSELVIYSFKLPSLFSYSFALIYLCNSIYLSRSSFLVVLKIVCWAYFFLLINRLIFNKSNR